MSRVGTRNLVAFFGLSLLCCGLLAALAIPLSGSGASVAAFACFAFPLALVCAATFVLLGLGCLPKAFYCDRMTLVIGLLAWAVGILLLWSASDGSSHSSLLAVLAGCFCGAGLAAGLASWLARLPEPDTMAFGMCLFGSAASAAVLCLPICVLPSVCFPLALVAGSGGQILGIVVPSLKNIPRRQDSAKVVARQRGFFVYLGTHTAVWSAALSYSTCHFFPMAIGGPGWMPLASLAMMALLFWGVTQAAAKMRATRRLQPFAAIKMYPIILAVGVVPLEYMRDIANFLQPMCLVGLFAATVVLQLFLAKECASLSSVSFLLCLGFIWGCAFAGAAAACLFEGFVGARTDTLFWAIAPLVCLVAGIVTCDFGLTEASLSQRLVLNSLESGSSFGESRLADQCRQVAREHDLTSRELEVLCLLVQGYSLAYVCEKLVIASGTATTHKQRIYKKLGVHTKNELIEFVSTAELKDS